MICDVYCTIYIFKTSMHMDIYGNCFRAEDHCNHGISLSSRSSTLILFQIFKYIIWNWSELSDVLSLIDANFIGVDSCQEAWVFALYDVLQMLEDLNIKSFNGNWAVRFVSLILHDHSYCWCSDLDVWVWVF